MNAFLTALVDTVEERLQAMQVGHLADDPRQPRDAQEWEIAVTAAALDLDDLVEELRHMVWLQLLDVGVDQ